MGRRFREQRNQQWVRFGDPWALALPEELDRLGASRVAILVSPRREAQGREIASALGSRAAGIVARARQHVPLEAVDAAAADVAALGADALVAVGGGSSIGLGKALALRAHRIVACLPTTYSGSEMTSIYGIRSGGTKEVGRDPRVRPDVVVYDPELTLALPLPISIVSLLNALAHAVDALYARGVTSEIEDLAAGAIADIAAAIDALPRAPRDRDTRERALHGAHLAGAILGRAGMAIQHKLAHVLAGDHDLPHAQTHAVLLPHVIAFNQEAAPRADALLARTLGAADPAAHVRQLAVRAGAPVDLASLGLTAEQARAAAGRMAGIDYDNPRRAGEAELAALIEQARTGSLRGEDR